jgi:hypothetical protein
MTKDGTTEDKTTPAHNNHADKNARITTPPIQLEYLFKSTTESWLRFSHPEDYNSTNTQSKELKIPVKKNSNTGRND